MGAIASSFQHGSHRLAYTVRGDGDRTVVLVHGLLLSRRMHAPLAEALAARGNLVITLDLLGHGESEHSSHIEAYSVAAFAGQVVGVLDHLGIDRAVVGGTSLGANVGLAVAVARPDRVQGLLIEMPVLDNALLAAAFAFTPLCMLLSEAPGLFRAATLPARLIPQTWVRGPLGGLAGGFAGVGLDVLRQDPAGAGRVLRGLLYGQAAPARAQRAAIRAPALVIGHPRDPIHPFSDSDMLAGELRNSRLLRASSLLELRLRPARLTAEIGNFVADCWEPAVRARRTA